MKLGILGGSFNPIHNGHLAMAEAARRGHDLDLVLFVPAGKPPHKREDLAPAEDRLHMVALALEGVPGLVPSDLEVSRPGTSYTVETLQEIRRRYPGAELFFILGEDSLPELPGWKDPERILELARIVTLNRPGGRAGPGPRGLPAEVLERIERDRVPMEPCEIASTQVRERVRSGVSIGELVPAKVADYIARRGLYTG